MNTTEEKPNETPQEPKKQCDWCRASIDNDALKCPQCGKWRKDIAEGRQTFFTNAAVGLLSVFVGSIFSIIVWTNSSGNSISAAFGNRQLGVWHERVATTSKPTEIMGTRIPGTNQTVSWKFSVRKFCSSWQGWLVVACAIGAVSTLVLAGRARNNLERKTGSRWRL